MIFEKFFVSIQICRYWDRSYISDPAVLDFDIKGARAARRPLPTGAKGETRYHGIAEIEPLCRDVPFDRRLFLKIIFEKYLISIPGLSRLRYTTSKRSRRGISIQFQRWTYHETSSPECCEGGKREPTDGRDSAVIPIPPNLR